jgi:hypothetical protein
VESNNGYDLKRKLAEITKLTIQQRASLLTVMRRAFTQSRNFFTAFTEVVHEKQYFLQRVTISNCEYWFCKVSENSFQIFKTPIFILHDNFDNFLMHKFLKYGRISLRRIFVRLKKRIFKTYAMMVYCFTICNTITFRLQHVFRVFFGRVHIPSTYV